MGTSTKRSCGASKHWLRKLEFAASIYMTFGRIIRCVRCEHHSFIRIAWITRAFVTADVLSFCIQGGSVGLMFQASTVKIGQNVVLVGLFVQTISFGDVSFSLLRSVIFQIRMSEFPTRASVNPDSPWKRTLYMLYIVSALVLLRSLFRIAEYTQSQDGYLLRHEWTLYIFDAVPMFLVTVVFYLQHPSKLPSPLAEDIEYVEMDSEIAGLQHKPKCWWTMFKRREMRTINQCDLGESKGSIWQIRNRMANYRRVIGLLIRACSYC